MREVVTIVVAVNLLVKVDAGPRCSLYKPKLAHYEDMTKLTYYNRGDKSVLGVKSRATSQ